MLRACLLSALLLACATTPALAAEPPALAQARALYNAADYAGAIQSAQVARAIPQWADAATLVMARAYIERHRQSQNQEDLAAARDALGAVRSAALTLRDQVDLYIGLGQVLYASGLFGAAAELFDTALGRAVTLSAADRTLLVDWWATAIDREAQSRPQERRSAMFDRLAARMQEELAHDPVSPVANYWLAVAARGSGNPDWAWDLAVAGWIRSAQSPASTSVRADLDKLVVDAIIPERARTRPAREQQAAAATLRAEWDLIKQQWK
jgi:hypothetical protein